MIVFFKKVLDTLGYLRLLHSKDCSALERVILLLWLLLYEFDAARVNGKLEVLYFLLGFNPNTNVPPRRVGLTTWKTLEESAAAEGDCIHMCIHRRFIYNGDEHTRTGNWSESGFESLGGSSLNIP